MLVKIAPIAAREQSVTLDNSDNEGPIAAIEVPNKKKDKQQKKRETLALLVVISTPTGIPKNYE